MNITELHAAGRYRHSGNLVLDVRSRHEHRLGHVPGSYNLPVDEITGDPRRCVPSLAPFDEVFIYCSSGERARRAHDALAGAGLQNLVLIEASGMPDWAEQGYPVERGISLARDLLTGLAAGLVAQLATAGVDRVLRQQISPRQKLREKWVREGSPHEVGGKRIGAKLLGRRLSRSEQRSAQIAFTVAYGLMWGAIYAFTRRRLPKAGALFGLPYAAGFFLACDGVLAPLSRMSPGLRKIPAQFNAKELANHVAWTATAEAVHRAAERLPR